MFNTGNIFDDAQDYIHRLDKLPSEPVHTEECDCCNNRVEDFRQAPDKGGYCCVECIGLGQAELYYIENGCTKEQMIKWSDNLKVK